MGSASGGPAWRRKEAVDATHLSTHKPRGGSAIAASDAVFACSDIYGNPGGDWVGPRASLSIGPCVPNPFRGATAIVFVIPSGVEGRAAALDIFDVSGRKVRELVQDAARPGRYEAIWNGRNDAAEAVQAGTYFCRLRCGDEVRTTRVVLVR